MSETDSTTLTAEQIRAEALAETNRIAAIRKACGGRFGEIEARAIGEGWDGPRTELEVLRASRPVTPAIHTRVEPATRDVLEAAILAHMKWEHLAERHLGADAAQRARDLRVTNLVDLCRVTLRIEGREEARRATPRSSATSARGRSLGSRRSPGLIRLGRQVELLF